MAHAYTEDQEAPRTLTQPLLCVAPSPKPLPGGEEIEQPAKAGGPPSPWPSPSGRGNDGLIAEYSAGPSPHPRPFSHWEKGGRQGGLRVRSLVLVFRLRAALERLNPALPRLLSGQALHPHPASPRGRGDGLASVERAGK